MTQAQEEAGALQEQILREMAVCPWPWPEGSLSPMRVREVLSKLTMDEWLPITWVVDGRRSDPRRGICVRVEFYVNRRDGGATTKISVPTQLRPCRDEDHLLHQAHQLLVKALSYVMDEFLLLEGVQLNEPHVGGVDHG